jgi:hypothetical protein
MSDELAARYPLIQRASEKHRKSRAQFAGEHSYSLAATLWS